MRAPRIISPLKRACAAAGMATLLMFSSGTTSMTATVTVEDQGKKKGDKSEKVKPAKDKGRDNDTNIIVVVDRDGHSRIIREYVTRGNLPPGLAKRRTLPPGLSKQLRERGTLPPGLREYYTPVPADWNPRFPAVPDYYERYFVGSHLIIIDTRDNTLVSLIRDLLN